MNLVLKNNSGSRRNFADEGTGEAQRVDARKIASRMGDRVRRSSDLNALKLKAATKRLKRQQQEEEEEREKAQSKVLATRAPSKQSYQLHHQQQKQQSWQQTRRLYLSQSSHCKDNGGRDSWRTNPGRNA